MSAVYVLDACAMLAVLSKEAGSDKVVDVYKKAAFGEVSLIMHKLKIITNLTLLRRTKKFNFDG
jgi:PIN domain nuclease of toxin-antitoxin system